MKIEPKKMTTILPKPYYKITFECSNRKFYDIKNDLYNLAEEIEIEIEDGYISEHCD